ncbi:hypothetical protein ACFL6F_02510 [Planctomycetota bacterium]
MYTLETKPDWNEAKERFTRWWNCEETDRPVLIIKARREKPLTDKPPLDIPDDPEAQWLDIDEIIEREKREFAYFSYMGEAFPNINPSLGPGTLGVYLGSEPGFSKHTVWYEKCFDSPKEACANLSEDNKWWQWTNEFSEKIVQNCEGDYIPAFPDFIENLDTAAQLMGTMETVYALNDVPDEMHRLQKEILESFFKAYDTLFEMMFPDQDESAFIAFEIWAPGRILKIQCDIAALLSPALFEEFAFPYFNKQCEKLDYVLYHLDGPGALYSLDALCGIEGINAIQWVSGAGAAPADDESWDHIYKKILDSGKGIHASVRPEHAKSFKKRFGSKGVFMRISGTFSSETEAGEFIKEMEK